MFGKNIKYLRSKRGLTQLDIAKKFGYKSSAIVNKWEVAGTVPYYKTITAIADYFGVSPEDLMAVDLEAQEQEMLSNLNNISVPAAKGIPVLGTICCGDGLECTEDYKGVFFVDNSIRADLCLDVKGDSMVDAGINDGDKAFLAKNCSYINGRVYGVVVGEDQNAVLRRVYWQDDTLILVPCNDAYKPFVTSEEETRIIGECVGYYHPMNR